jgi:S-disulfanyl-L-cysteine oxidoreductase SoxD
MRLKIGAFVSFVCIGMAAFAASYATVRASQETTKTTWDGVYSDAQAQRGEALYNDKCAKCHGPDGSGGDAPVLVGGDFASDWDGLTMAQLFDRLRSSMPQDNPQSLTREDAASLLGFILQKNNFPSGPTDLPTAGEYLGQIKYVAVKPAQ